MNSSRFYFLFSKFCIILLLSTFYFLFSFSLVEAAKLGLTSEIQEIGLSQQFQVDLVLDTENEEINAVEGKVIFPGDLLELKEIRDGNSIVNFWIERPKVEQTGIIGFSGIIPGGYVGKKGLIFSAIFQSKNEGEGIIEIREAKTLLNDGKGTEASLSNSNFQLSILKQPSIPQIPIPEIKDTDLPEDFKPEAARNLNIFEDRWFLVFATQDKGSGIDRYEVLENRKQKIENREWIKADSPYLLKDQELKSYIYVKAVDKAGNERIATLSPQNPLKWYENYFVLFIIIISMIFVYLILRRVKRFRFGGLFLLGIILAIVNLALPVSAFAASLYFSPTTGNYNVGQTFSVSVYVSSADQSMNAASGIISFPKDKLNVVSLSKTGSIFSLWVQDPTFSNSAGTITFEGIVFNPGFIGSAGKVITINFKTKEAGSVPLTFSSGSVLANDGKGTNILTSMGSGSYVIQSSPEEEEYIPPKNTPVAPIVSSPTHPDSEKWYSSNNPKFTWEVPEGVTGAKLLVDHKPIAVPTVFYSEPIAEKQLEDLADDIWYFHVQLKNKSGLGGVSHFKFQIDTASPLSFEIEVKEGKETTNPQPTLVFETTDEMSGVDYYQVRIDQEPLIETREKEYKIPVQTFGTHTIIVRAVDKAGNNTLAMTEINILPIGTPVITDYPQTLLPGATLSIKGTAVPETQVKVYIQKDEKEVKTGETKSDAEGRWSYIGTESLEKGVYKIWAEVIDSLGAKSEPSEKVTIQVIPPAFIRIGSLVIDYLTTVVTLLILISVIVFGIVWGWRKIIKRKRRLRKEITEAERALFHAFKVLKEETEEQIEKLDGEPGLSDREKEICDELKKSLKTSEKFIGKEIKDIEKELK